jgi:hypothetical protein
LYGAKFPLAAALLLPVSKSYVAPEKSETKAGED